MTARTARGVATIEKSLELFLSLVDDAGQTPLSAFAQQSGIPVSTAQRIVAAFVRSGLLARVERGRYAAGVRLASGRDPKNLYKVIIAASRPLLHRLAYAVGATVHLGVLESDMVTYLVKEHGGGTEVLTREMMQLEAYCSAIGKVLLANLDEARLSAYLAAGPFVPLTRNTITDPALLHSTLLLVRDQDYAIDDAEVDDDLYCVAVPLRGANSCVIAAISVSRRSNEPISPTTLDLLKDCSIRIGSRLGLSYTRSRSMGNSIGSANST